MRAYNTADTMIEGKFADFAKNVLTGAGQKLGVGVPKARRLAGLKKPLAYDRPLQYKLMGMQKDTSGKFDMYPEYSSYMLRGK